MSINLRIFSIIAITIYFLFLLGLLKRKTMMLKYSLLWIFAGVVMALFVSFPGLLSWMMSLVGVQVASNGLFVICIGAIILIVMALTVIVSFQKKRLQMLSQAIALLEEEVSRMKEERVDVVGSCFKE